MAAVLSKRKMTEEDIKLQFITPAITKKWALSLITMETRITDGQINLRGNMVSRKEAKKADYILYLNESTPIAIVEAKDNKHAVGDGLQQAMQYAIMMDIPFAYSSNGDGFMEHDFLTGEERSISMEDFPAPDALYARFKAGANHGEGLTQQEESIIRQPFYSGQNTYPPRYYQRNAVNRTLDAIARGEDRILLVMATGTGKTYTAFQIVYRLLKSGMKKKILYLADRNILVDQSIQQDFAPLEKTIHELPFEIPESWAWVRWGAIAESIQYGYNAPAKQEGRIRMVRISDIHENTVAWSSVPFCDIDDSDIPTYLLQANDILFARTGGTVGKSFLVSEVPCESIYAGYLIRTRYSSLLCPQYLKYFMESPLYWQQLKSGTTATAQPNCNGQTLAKMLLPLPPANEQLRIVDNLARTFAIIERM